MSKAKQRPVAAATDTTVIQVWPFEHAPEAFQRLARMAKPEWVVRIPPHFVRNFISWLDFIDATGHPESYPQDDGHLVLIGGDR